MTWRIRRRAVFADLREHGRQVRGGGVWMTYCPQPDPQPMVAFAFGRKFGNAVERNRARRRLRDAFDAAWADHEAPIGAFLLGGNRSVLSKDFDRLVGAVASCLRQLGEPAIEDVTRSGSSAPSEVGR